MAGAYNLSAPAIAAPDGVTPDFENPPNQNAVAWGLLTLMMVVSTACVGLRGWAKSLNQRVRVEDWMILGAYVRVDILLICPMHFSIFFTLPSASFPLTSFSWAIHLLGKPFS